MYVGFGYDMTSFNRIELAHKLTHKQQNVIYFYREYIKYSHLEFHFRGRCCCCRVCATFSLYEVLCIAHFYCNKHKNKEWYFYNKRRVSRSCHPIKWNDMHCFRYKMSIVFFHLLFNAFNKTRFLQNEAYHANKRHFHIIFCCVCVCVFNFTIEISTMTEIEFIIASMQYVEMLETH